MFKLNKNTVQFESTHKLILKQFDVDVLAFLFYLQQYINNEVLLYCEVYCKSWYSEEEKDLNLLDLMSNWR